MDLKIENMSSHDLDNVIELSAQLGYKISRSQAEERFLEISILPNYALFVAKINTGKIVGWIQINFEPTSLLLDTRAEVAGLVVDEKYRGQKIGSKLLAQAEEWAREQGVKLIRLRSSIKRSDAHRFYQREGYTLLNTSHLFVKEIKNLCIVLALHVFFVACSSTTDARRAPGSNASTPAGDSCMNLISGFNSTQSRVIRPDGINETKMQKLLSMGWDENVLKSIEKYSPSIAQSLMQKNKDIQPLTVYRGIAAGAEDYDPVFLGLDGRKFMSTSKDVALNFANEMIIESQIPHYLIRDADSINTHYLGADEIKITSDILPDDRAIMKRIGLIKRRPVKRGRFTKTEIEIKWFFPIEALDESGRIKQNLIEDHFSNN